MKLVSRIPLWLVLYVVTGVTSANANYMNVLRAASTSGDRDGVRQAQAALIDALDERRHDIDYHETITLLKDNVLAVIGGQRDKDGPVAVASAEVLCRMLPWTLGSVEEDLRASGELYTVFARAFPKDMRFARFLDCAHANTKASYFGFLQMHYNLWPDASCRFDTLPSMHEIETVLEVGTKVAERLHDSTGTYYGPRIALRLAVFHAALANYAIKMKDVEVAEEQFGKAYGVMKKWDSAGQLGVVRNGWRLYSDFFVLGAFYQFLSGERKKALNRLEARDSKLVAVLQYEETLRVDEDVIRNIRDDGNNDYVDPIYIERLLPGAAIGTENECRRWFRYGFPARSLSDGLVECLGSMGEEPLNVTNLVELDNCLTSKEPVDWWLQLESYSKRSDAELSANRFGVRFGESIGKKLGLEQGIRFTVVEPSRESRYFRVRTEDALTRWQVGVVENIILDELPSLKPLVGRDQQY